MLPCFGGKSDGIPLRLLHCTLKNYLMQPVFFKSLRRNCKKISLVIMPWLHTKTNDNLSTNCLQFVYNLSSICPNFFLVLSEFCHNKNKTKQRQTTNCRQFVDNLSFVFVLSYFCIQFVICLYFVLFLL